MGSCLAFVDLQLDWCAAAGIHMRDIVPWSSHEWVFDRLHNLNNPRTILAYVSFVSRVCARVDDPGRHSDPKGGPVVSVVESFKIV